MVLAAQSVAGLIVGIARVIRIKQFQKNVEGKPMRDFEYQPIETLPDDADPTDFQSRKYSFGSDVFGGTAS